jgi:hypothetical protein
LRNAVSSIFFGFPSNQLLVGVRKELGQIFIEIEIVADDGAHRRLHRLVAVAFGEMRLELLFRLARLDEKEAGRAAIRRGRPKLQEIDQLVQQRVGNFAGKRIMRPARYGTAG